MNQAAEAFLNDIWSHVNSIYDKESRRVREIKNQSRLQAGMFDYLGVAWRKGKFNWVQGNIHIDVYEPFSWSDSSYTFEAGAYIEELTDDILAQDFFPALRDRVDALFRSDDYGPRFFDYRLELVFEFEREQSVLRYSQALLNEEKLRGLKQTFDNFIDTKIMLELPVLPKENDEFFFARHLMNPDLMEQRQEVIEPLIRRLSDKLRTRKERSDSWAYQYTAAFKDWSEERFLNRFFDRSGNYGLDWVLKEEPECSKPNAQELEFFMFAALKIGPREPDTREKYLKLAVQLGSKRAEDYLKQGSGRFESVYKSSLIQATANDITQTIEIHIGSEEEAAYGEALNFIGNLLDQGFPKGYKLMLKSKEKNFLPLKKLARSGQHQFFANAARYPALFPRLAAYAELAMEEFAWYEDVKPGEKSVMPGTYAVFGLGLYSNVYFPLVRRYMELVDTEHQSAQDGYAEAFIEAHGVTAEHMPTIVSILLGGSESAKPVKNIAIDTPDLADALIRELESKEDYKREAVIYRIFGSSQKLAQAAKRESSPLKERLERLLELLG
ncbi:DUF6138 family protein [Paenibacillus sp. DMB20]|uniref:DUF6138 family protein n=1 Tax=Paenibacillus sp. DMB20 TaxID=1642570 RepID=UPI00062809C6|nr:DUF6138 family protein [Paenibacillus sp. DMB20]KKO52852.1 hypothetical protein XI25_16595 [Paenibacillus sp. DMB20]KKO53786.1 hypothetical protein XI25_12560 [Paenibacillus sp. DMB20]